MLRFVEVDAATGETRSLIEETPETFVNYSNKTFLREIEGGAAWLWMSERSGWNHLYRVDSESGAARAVTTGDWLVRRVLRVDDAAQTITFEAMGVHPDQDPYHVHRGARRLRRHGPGVADPGRWHALGDRVSGRTLADRHVVACGSPPGPRAALG